MKNLAKLDADRTVVRVGRHYVFHKGPPAFADICFGDRGPAFFRFDLGIAE